MKINMPKRSPAQLRKRESQLLEELCTYHGYRFADSLRSSERSTMVMVGNGKKAKLELGFCLKFVVPANGALGQQIAKLRESKT